MATGALVLATLSALLLTSNGINPPPDVESPSSSGVPCYLRPTGDACHYDQRLGSEMCTTPHERKRVNQGIVILNRTLMSLEQQLIRSGVIPADNHCSELPSVPNGGIIYDDLNLSPGAMGRYVCDSSYILQPLYGQYEFTCTEDGIWDGNVTDVPVECLLSSERCDPPEDIPYGNISYLNDDPSNVLVGDVITYSCEEGADLQGPRQRFCLRTGNWSEDQPQCVVGDANDHNQTTPGDHRKEIIGASVGSASAVVLIVAVVVTTVVCYKCWQPMKKKLSGHTVSTLEVSDSYNDTTGILSHDEHVTYKESDARKKKKGKSMYRSTEESFHEMSL